MNEKVYLNHQYQLATHPHTNSPQTMIFLHGLFGDLNNLGVIARAFADQYHILRVDLRNHGQSFHHDEMNYRLMADDVNDLCAKLGIDNAIVVGHSMGGKTAMALAHHHPQRVAKLVVIDIAPVAYLGNRHDANFAGLFAVRDAQATNRQQAKQAMSHAIADEGVQQFMLKSFDPQKADYFKFNLTALYHNYRHLMDWENVRVDKPTLFIKGERSDYLQAKDTDIILQQFSQAKSFVISNADHWVHAVKPDAVIRAMQKFLA